VVLYIRDCFGCIELNNSDDKVECLWVKMRGSKVEGDITRLTRDEPRGGRPGLGVRSITQPKCIYTNAHSMGK